MTKRPDDVAGPDDVARNDDDTSSEDFELLDGFVQHLHRGDGADEREVSRSRPDLASLLRCIAALDAMASPVKSVTTIGVADATLDFGSSAVDASAADEDLPEADEPERARFGDYDLLEEIGRGGMGVVYKARQRRLGRIVALKMIQAGRWASGEQRRRFESEARSAAGVTHSGIVNIFDAGEVHGQSYYCMEYVEGESLAGRLARGRMTTDEAITLLIQIAGAVQALHEAGVVHRDLKPSNILLGEDDAPLVTDFGLAKVFDGQSQTASNMIAGTPAYMSPEQASGRSAEVDARSDVYSLGALFYEVAHWSTAVRGGQTAGCVGAGDRTRAAATIDGESACQCRFGANLPEVFGKTSQASFTSRPTSWPTI